jgi:pimeloyl-ACP methyl ester carboxylesterase
MNNVRKYGKEPFEVVLLHGGPGAPGHMAPVARELSSSLGVLEPLQTASSVQGQVKELKSVLETNSDPPVVLLGFSWGAWLAFISAAQYPNLVKKLILVSSGGFEEPYAEKIGITRMNRLDDEDRMEAHLLMNKLGDSAKKEKDKILARLGELFTKADAYHPLTLETEETGVSFDIYQKVWQQAEEMRRCGRLLKMGNRIQCPVVAIHGDYDSHPAAGVQIPLSKVLADFQFFLLKNCGHMPWIEKEAKDLFFNILRREIQSSE